MKNINANANKNTVSENTILIITIGTIILKMEIWCRCTSHFEVIM